jgi:transcriptional regulator with XRE-family HTH domain
VNKPSTPLGLRIRRLRQEHGWTQEELSTISGVSQVYISRLESGHTKTVKVDTFYKLAKALGVSMDSLYGVDDTPSR